MTEASESAGGFVVPTDSTQSLPVETPSNGETWENPESSPTAMSNSTAEFGATVPVELPEVSHDVLEKIARQVEYYFSDANLARDTYVSTLRSLNDGYVPISIISNFGKVKALVGFDPYFAVRQAAMEFSSLLEVVQVDSHTGRRLHEYSSDDVQTVEAVGPISQEAIPVGDVRAALVPASESTTAEVVQNTVIIREVPEGVEESHVRELFTFDKCPPIQSLHLDVANCWFVTLDASTRDDMVHVMFSLRTMRFSSGEVVKARLKSTASLNSQAAPFNPNSMPMHPPQVSLPHNQMNASFGGKKNKRKKNYDKSKMHGGNGQNKNGGKGKNHNNGGYGQRRNGGKPKKNGVAKQEGRASPNGKKDIAKAHPPPTFGEEQFPSLPSEETINKNMVKVEKVPEQRPDDEIEKSHANSDSGSTATTSSSSSIYKHAPVAQPPQPLGGYAAALRKAAPPKPTPPKSDSAAKSQPKGDNKKGNKKKNAKGAGAKSKQPSSNKPKVLPKKGTSEASAANAVSKPSPRWGGSRSFADILRKEKAGRSVAVAPEQTA